MSSLVGPDLPNSRRVGLVTQIVARSASEISRLRLAADAASTCSTSRRPLKTAWRSESSRGAGWNSGCAP